MHDSSSSMISVLIAFSFTMFLGRTFFNTEDLIWRTISELLDVCESYGDRENLFMLVVVHLASFGLKLLCMP